MAFRKTHNFFIFLSSTQSVRGVGCIGVKPPEPLIKKYLPQRSGGDGGYPDLSGSTTKKATNFFRIFFPEGWCGSSGFMLTVQLHITISFKMLSYDFQLVYMFLCIKHGIHLEKKTF